MFKLLARQKMATHWDGNILAVYDTSGVNAKLMSLEYKKMSYYSISGVARWFRPFAIDQSESAKFLSYFRGQLDAFEKMVIERCRTTEHTSYSICLDKIVYEASRGDESFLCHAKNFEWYESSYDKTLICYLIDVEPTS